MSMMDRAAMRKLPEVENPFQWHSILEEELKKRIEKVQKSKKKGAFQRFMRKITGKVATTSTSMENDIYGEVIAKHFPLKKMQACVELLQIDPKDSDARMTLTEPFATKGIKGNLIVYREVFLHAMIELSFDRLSSRSLNIGIMAQRRYLEKLTEFINEEIKNIQDKMTETGNDQSFLIQQSQKLRQGAFTLKESVSILKAKQFNEEYECELQTFLTSTPDRQEINTRLAPLMNLLVTLPLMRDVTLKWVEALKKNLPRMPVPFFYEARMYRLYAKILLECYTRGDLSVAKVCAKQLLASWNAINAGMGYVGNLPKSKLDQACVREYALTCYSLSQEMPKLGIKPPSNNKKRLEDAIARLSPISDQPGVPELQNALGSAIAQNEADEAAAKQDRANKAAAE